MLQFVSKLRDNDFVDLMVAIKKMKYGDIKVCEYADKDNCRNVHVWDNNPSFNDREPDQYFSINDFNISEDKALFDYYLFMLNQFGDDWYDVAKNHFIQLNDFNRLEKLENAKKEIDNILSDDAVEVF